MPEIDMPEIDLQSITAADGRELLAAAEAGWSRPIPHCPDWNAAQLVGHMGGILAWMATIVATGNRVARRDREQPPTELDALAAWYTGHLERTLSILTSTGPEAPAWTFSSRGDQRVRWWRRRLAVELAIHRWDAQDAASLECGPSPGPVDGDVAAAGIEEFVTEFLPGLLAGDSIDGMTGSLHLHATDGPSEWWIDLDARANALGVAEHLKADTAIRASRSDLLLWLTNRDPSVPPVILGQTKVATNWPQLRR